MNPSGAAARVGAARPGRGMSRKSARQSLRVPVRRATASRPSEPNDGEADRRLKQAESYGCPRGVLDGRGLHAPVGVLQLFILSARRDELLATPITNPSRTWLWQTLRWTLQAAGRLVLGLCGPGRDRRAWDHRCYNVDPAIYRPW